MCGIKCRSIRTYQYQVVPVVYSSIRAVVSRETHLFVACSSSCCPVTPFRFPPPLAFDPTAGGFDGRCLGSLARLAPPGGAPLGGGGTRPLRLMFGGGGSEGGGGPRLGRLSMNAVFVSPRSPFTRIH